MRQHATPKPNALPAFSTRARRFAALVIAGGALALLACAPSSASPAAKPTTKTYEVKMSDTDWKQKLTPEQFEILRKKGTERAFTGKFWDHHELGTYTCAGCGQRLFSSEHKFESGSGWPSYYQPLGEGAVVTETDTAYGMSRTEILCARCGGHLGHVFNDGPRPTGERYCVNSASLDFEPLDTSSAKGAEAPAAGAAAPKAPDGK